MKWYQYSLSCHAHSKSTNDSTRPHTASVSIPVFLGYGNGTTCPKIALPGMLRVLVYFSFAYIIQALAAVHRSTKNCFLQSCYMSIVSNLPPQFQNQVYTPVCTCSRGCGQTIKHAHKVQLVLSVILSLPGPSHSVRQVAQKLGKDLQLEVRLALIHLQLV